MEIFLWNLIEMTKFLGNLNMFIGKKVVLGLSGIQN